MSSEQPKPYGNLAGFNSAAEKKAAADVLPAGEYDLVVASCKMGRNAANTYEQVVVELKVLNGEYQNRTIFQRLAFRWVGQGAEPDSAKTACRIGRGTFAKICEASGVPAPNDTSDLVGKSFRAKLRVKDGKGEYDDANVIAKATARTAGAAPAGGPPPGVTGGKW